MPRAQYKADYSSFTCILNVGRYIGRRIVNSMNGSKKCQQESNDKTCYNDTLIAIIYGIVWIGMLFQACLFGRYLWLQWTNHKLERPAPRTNKIICSIMFSFLGISFFLTWSAFNILRIQDLENRLFAVYTLTSILCVVSYNLQRIQGCSNHILV